MKINVFVNIKVILTLCLIFNQANALFGYGKAKHGASFPNTMIQ